MWECTTSQSGYFHIMWTCTLSQSCYYLCMVIRTSAKSGKYGRNRESALLKSSHIGWCGESHYAKSSQIDILWESTMTPVTYFWQCANHHVGKVTTLDFCAFAHWFKVDILADYAMLLYLRRYFSWYWRIKKPPINIL